MHRSARSRVSECQLSLPDRPNRICSVRERMIVIGSSAEVGFRSIPLPPRLCVPACLPPFLVPPVCSVCSAPPQGQASCEGFRIRLPSCQCGDSSRVGSTGERTNAGEQCSGRQARVTHAPSHGATAQPRSQKKKKNNENPSRLFRALPLGIWLQRQIRQQHTAVQHTQHCTPTRAEGCAGLALACPGTQMHTRQVSTCTARAAAPLRAAARPEQAANAPGNSQVCV
jgi:hypothetical protein